MYAFSSGPKDSMSYPMHQNIFFGDIDYALIVRQIESELLMPSGRFDGDDGRFEIVHGISPISGATH